MGLDLEVERTYSVLPLIFFSFPSPIQDYFTSLQQFQAPFLEEKLLTEDFFSFSPQEYSRTFVEFKKFVGRYSQKAGQRINVGNSHKVL